MQVVTPEIKIKCVIWDLDDTLWDGSLAENDKIVPRHAVIDLIRRLDEKGVVNSLCSKNSYDAAKDTLGRLGVWSYFVFPVLDFVPKGQNVKKIVQNLQLRPENVVFIDDGIGNRNEVEYYCPGITVLDACDPHFISVLNEVVDRTEGTSRLDQYKTLERKGADRAHYADNEEFLQASKITACVLRNPADLIFRRQIFNLANRTNQLNFTGSRFSTLEELNDYLTGPHSPEINHGVVFVYDNYGDYGLVGFYAFNEAVRSPHLDHFYFSCRILNMGIEQAVYSMLRKEWNLRRLGPLDGSRRSSGSHVRIIRDLDGRIRKYLEAEPLSPLSYKTSVVAGCTSGIIDHYLSETMRPVRFDLSVVPHGKVLPDAGTVIYTAYSDYVSRPWHGAGGFSHSRFRGNLAEFMAKHRERHIYLLLASEKESGSEESSAFLRVRRLLSKARWALLDGQNRVRYTRCNQIVRHLAKSYPNVTLVETGDFVNEESEQPNPTHFSRVVVKRICDYIAELHRETAGLDCADTRHLPESIQTADLTKG